MPATRLQAGVCVVVLCSIAATANAENRILEVPTPIKVWAYEPEQEGADPDGWRERLDRSATIQADYELLTARATRAELRLDFPNWLRIEESSTVWFPILRAHQYFVEIEGGIVQYSQYLGSSADIRLRTSLALIVPLQNGRYEIQALDDGQVRITVRAGSLRILSKGESRDLIDDRTMLLRERDGEIQFLDVQAAPVDGWYRWNRARDKEATRLAGYRALRHDVLSAWRTYMRSVGCWPAIIDVLD